MRLARRGFILGGVAMLSGCATAAAQTASVQPLVTVTFGPQLPARPAEVITSQLNTTRPLDPRSQVRQELMDRAMAHCDSAGGGRCWLTTFAGLGAARALYERHGFVLDSESAVDQWRGGVREQLFARPAQG